MLREDVVQAVRDGQFHIYEVSTVDEALEVLTGVGAGERQDDGSYPEGSIHQLRHEKLEKMSEALRRSGPAPAPPAAAPLHEPAQPGQPPPPPAPPRTQD